MECELNKKLLSVNLHYCQNKSTGLWFCRQIKIVLAIVQYDYGVWCSCYNVYPFKYEDLYWNATTTIAPSVVLTTVLWSPRIPTAFHLL